MVGEKKFSPGPSGAVRLPASQSNEQLDPTGALLSVHWAGIYQGVNYLQCSPNAWKSYCVFLTIKEKKEILKQLLHELGA